jgi:dTDP-4-amino-4,6-dideoxygalactose transaminase
MEVTDEQASRLIRLPLWTGISHQQQDRVVAMLNQAITHSDLSVSKNSS